MTILIEINNGQPIPLMLLLVRILAFENIAKILTTGPRLSQTIPMRNSPWEKRILQGITISLGPAIL